MNILFLKKNIALASTLLTGVAFFEPVPASAQFGGFAGALLGAALSHGYRGGGRYYGSRSHGSRAGRSHNPDDANSVDTDSASSKERDKKIFASLAVPSRTQTAVFKSLVPTNALGAVGASDDIDKLEQTSSTDEDRDYTKLIGDLIEKFTKSEAKQEASGEGDITEHAILQAVDDSYKHAGLERFSTFVGENWSLERLRVMILKRVDAESDSLIHGTNKGRVSMGDLRGVIDKSANSIYQRLFETSELLAANHSSSLFVQLLYQTHGDAATGEVREGAERMLMHASGKVSGDFDNLIHRDPRSYALNYRKQRIVFDCLSENIVKVTSALQGIATPAEIDKRIGDVAATSCKDWLNNQFLTADKKLKTQDPVPLRVIWSKTGLVDDQSMYSHPADAL
jgi:hypothetical protein